MKRNTLKILILIFNGICSIFPFGMAIIFAAVYIGGGWEFIIPEHDLDYYFLPPVKHPFISFILLFLIFFSIYILYHFLLSLKDSVGSLGANIFAILSIFLIACIIRFTIAFAFRECIQPFSDFQRVWDMVHGNLSGHIDYYTLFPAYMNFATFEKCFIKIFGDQYIYIIYFNCITASFTASILYLIGKTLFQDEMPSILMGMLYALMPSNIVYCAVSTPEFLTITANILGTFVLLKLYEKTGYKQILYAGLGGLFLGVGSSYKSFSIIIVLAFSMSFLSKRMLSFSKKRCLTSFIIIFVFAGYLFSTTSILQNTEAEFNIELDNNTAYPYYILIGLNTKGEGQIHCGNLSREYYLTYLNNGHDIESARRYAEELLKENWRKNPKEILPHFAKKMIWAFQDDVIPFYYWNTYLNITPDTMTEKFMNKFISEYMSSFSQLYYFFLMLLAFISCIRSVYEKINCQQEFIMLICFGYFCLIFLSEAQSRYKCLIMPYVCILSAVALYKCIKSLNFSKKKMVQF